MAQNLPNYSQYMLHQSIINPAAVGRYNDMGASALYKYQWAGIKGAPRIANIDFFMPLPNDQYNSNSQAYVSAIITDERIGARVSDQLTVSYAYRIELGEEGYLTFGLGGTLGMEKTRNELIETTDPDDPIFIGNSPTLFTPNFRAGLYYHTPKYYAGFSIPNILTNTYKLTGTGYKGAINYSALTSHYILHGGMRFDISDNMAFTPSVLIKSVGGAPIQLDLNAHLIFGGKFGVGLSYRTEKILVAMINYKATQNILVGYSFNYDLTLLNKFTNGSHELILTYTLDDERTNLGVGYVR